MTVGSDVAVLLEEMVLPRGVEPVEVFGCAKAGLEETARFGRITLRTSPDGRTPEVHVSVKAEGDGGLYVVNMRLTEQGHEEPCEGRRCEAKEVLDAVHEIALQFAEPDRFCELMRARGHEEPVVHPSVRYHDLTHALLEARSLLMSLSGRCHLEEYDAVHRPALRRCAERIEKIAARDKNEKIWLCAADLHAWARNPQAQTLLLERAVDALAGSCVAAVVTRLRGVRALERMGVEGRVLLFWLGWASVKAAVEADSASIMTAIFAYLEKRGRLPLAQDLAGKLHECYGPELAQLPTAGRELARSDGEHRQELKAILLALRHELEGLCKPETLSQLLAILDGGTEDEVRRVACELAATARSRSPFIACEEWWRAEAALEANSPTQACTLYTAALEKLPQAAWLHGGAAWAWLRAGEPQKARAMMTRAVELAPDDADLLMRRGMISCDYLSDHQGAVDDFTASLRLDRFNAECFACRALALQALGETDKALQDFSVSLALEEKPGTLYGRGTLLMECKRYDEAGADFDRAIALHPEFAEAWINRGVCKRLSKHLDAAIADFDEGLKLKPSLINGLWNRGLAYAQAGNATEAIRELEKFLSLDDTSEMARSAREVLDKIRQQATP